MAPPSLPPFLSFLPILTSLKRLWPRSLAPGLGLHKGVLVPSSAGLDQPGTCLACGVWGGSGPGRGGEGSERGRDPEAGSHRRACLSFMCSVVPAAVHGPGLGPSAPPPAASEPRGCQTGSPGTPNLSAASASAASPPPPPRVCLVYSLWFVGGPRPPDPPAHPSGASSGGGGSRRCWGGTPLSHPARPRPLPPPPPRPPCCAGGGASSLGPESR